MQIRRRPVSDLLLSLAALVLGATSAIATQGTQLPLMAGGTGKAAQRTHETSVTSEVSLDLERQRIQHPDIDESSGLVESRLHPGVFWTHNDSGDSARIFAIESDGSLIGQVAISGARNVDWEDIAVDEFGFLYIGDHGNNNSRRSDLGIYVVREPDPTTDRQARVVSHLRFIYPDQPQPPDGAIRNFDSEALFYARGDLYLLTKHRMDKFTRLYRLPLEPRTESQVPVALSSKLEHISSFDMSPDGSQPGIPDRRAMVTAADATADGSIVAVLAYGMVMLFEGAPTSSAEANPAIDFLVKPPLRRIELPVAVARQCESIAWLANGDLVIGNEQRDLLYLRQPLQFLDQ